MLLMSFIQNKQKYANILQVSMMQNIRKSLTFINNIIYTRAMGSSKYFPISFSLIKFIFLSLLVLHIKEVIILLKSAFL